MTKEQLALLQHVAWRSTPINMARHLTSQLPNARAHVSKPAHIAFLSQRFVDAATGRRPRQIVTIPPQHGKSWHTSWWGPVWFLDWFPTKRVILASYATQFANSWGRRVRDTLELFKDYLRVRVRENVTAVSEWETTAGGGMITAGVGAGIAGRAADLLIIDDPHKDAAEAQSAVYRKRAWDWWQSVAESRLAPDAAVIVVTTRWHEQDLAGRLLATPDSGDWELVRLPALSDEDRSNPATGKTVKAAPDALGRAPGEALWPERYSTEYLQRRRRNMHRYWWDTIYQQTPPEQVEGAVYSSFDSQRNVAGGRYPKVLCDLDPALPVQIRLDFNRDPGMHAVVGQYHRQRPRFRSRYVIHEPRMTIQQMAQVFHQLLVAVFGKSRVPDRVIDWKLPAVEVFGDATGRETQMSDGRSNWLIVARYLAEHGIPCKLRVKKRNPGVKDRVNAVNEALLTPDGDTEYLIHPDCDILINDRKNARWDGEEIDKTSDVLVSHASDADDYAVEYLMPARSPRVPGRGELRVATV